MAAPTDRDLQDRLRALLEPTVEAQGCELAAVILGRNGGRRVVRIHVDRPGGVGLDDCRRVSLALSPLLDAHDPLPWPYDLEVSSPGMDRPLQRLADFARFTGYRVKMKLLPGAGRARLAGVLRGVEGGEIRVEAEGAVHAIAPGLVDRANLVLDFDEYRRLGSVDLDDGTPGPGGPGSP